jgi:hypothetical protein
MRGLRRTLVAGFVCAAVLGAGPVQAAPEEIRAKDIHKDAVVRYTRWAFERPPPTGRLLPDECEVRGRNTFLPSSVDGDPAVVEDDCTTVASKGFFAPVAVCFFFEGPTLPRSELRDTVRDCLFGEIGVQEFSATVDGQVVELPRRRSFIITKPFKVDFFQQGEVATVVGGWFFRIHPLPPGEHVIRLRVVFKDGFTSDVVTHVTVVPG